MEILLCGTRSKYRSTAHSVEKGEKNGKMENSRINICLTKYGT